MRNLKENPNFSGRIALDTDEIGKIRSIQFHGIIKLATPKEKALYLKNYHYAIALKPTLWSLHVEYRKFTYNRLDFGKKKQNKVVVKYKGTKAYRLQGTYTFFPSSSKSLSLMTQGFFLIFI